MTNTPLPLNARRSIIAESNTFVLQISAAASRIAFENLEELPASENDDENIETINAFTEQIARQIFARINLYRNGVI